MSASRFKCPVCGGPVYPVKVRPSQPGALPQYRCNCRNCAQKQEVGLSANDVEASLSQFDGFDEVGFEQLLSLRREPR